jgi:hypothetical protein
MLTNDIILAFNELGWRTYREGSERLTTFDLADRRVKLFIRLKQLTSTKKLICNNSVTTSVFSAACANILGRKDSYTPLIGGDEGLYRPDFTFEDIRALSKRLIDWVKIQDIGAALKDLRELQTDAKGAFPRRHLAALAIAGDVERLEYYQQSFASGDRLDFVPYISKEMIDRALDIARSAAKSSL